MGYTEDFRANLVRFVKYWFPPIILFLGLVGNTLGSIVIWRPKLIKIGPVSIYKYLFIMDTFYLLEIIASYIQYGFGPGVNTTSKLFCKLANYVNFSLAIVSPMLLVYIAVDRYISIKFPSKRFIFRKEKTQCLFLVASISYNFIYYIPVYLFKNIYSVRDNLTNQTSKVCKIDEANLRLIVSLMDLVNRVFLPFLFMLSSSILLIHALFQSRNRIVENFLADENKTFYAEIRLTTTSLSLNLIYILLNLPKSVIDIFPSIYTLNLFIYSYYLFYLSYALNFYILLLSNSLFRNEFISMLKLNKQSTPMSLSNLT